jgi:DNA-binding NtrC family response regulator
MQTDLYLNAIFSLKHAKQLRGPRLNFLIVEDDKLFRHKLKTQLDLFGNTSEASSKEQAMGQMAARKFDLCFIDLNLDEDSEKFDGFDLVSFAHNKGLKTIVLTSHNGSYTKIESYKRGCAGYIVKKKFLTAPEKYIKPLMSKVDSFLLDDFFENQFITSHLPLIESIKKLKDVVTAGKHSILLTGETGVGKTSIAKLIHQLSGIKEEKFIHLNVGQIPDNLIEAELFGTVRGAFTGAVDKIGLLETANGGTVFLDEIDSLPKSSQVKIQVALEEGKFFKVGGNKPIHSSFRLISATCNDLYSLIQSNKLREDFFYRIRGFEVPIPALRERAEDIELITAHLLRDLDIEMVFTDDALGLMKQFSWPGNIRQLKDFIHSFQVTGQNYIDKTLAKKKIATLAVKGPNSRVLSNRLKKIIDQNGLQYLIDKIEYEALTQAMEDTGNLTKAAEKLIIGNRRAKRIYENSKTVEAQNQGLDE